MKNSELFDMDGCVVKSHTGQALAKLTEDGEFLIVNRLPTCSIGMYFYILCYLKELGFNVR